MRLFRFASVWRIVSVMLLSIATISVAHADSGPDHQAHQLRPIELGTSGGNITDRTRSVCYGGTLGALVQDSSGAQYILSNNHVLAKTNTATIGDDIVQPGLIDMGCQQLPADAVADLSNYVPIGFKAKKTTPLNSVDAAVAATRPGSVRPDGSIIDIGIISNLTAQDQVDCAVKKSGRTTGLTSGTISAVDVTVDVNYGKGKVARFTDQFLVTPGSFSAGGDSGSLIVRDGPSPRAVGLLFAGSSSYTIANPISAVLGAFGASMVGIGDGTGDCPVVGGGAASTDAKATKGRHEEALLNIPDVVGVGVGRGGTIELFLARENASSRARIPAALDGVPVHVTVTGEFTAR